MLHELSLIALEGGFWSSVLSSLVAAPLWAAIAWLGWSLIRILQRLCKARRTYYSINGIWIGTCTLPRDSGEVEGIEIYHLNKSKGNITLSFFHYRPDKPKITRYEGAGVYRGAMISAFYYIADSKRAESGVIVLQRVGETFKGGYAQYIPSTGKLYQSSSFILRRIQISLWSQVRMLWFRQPPFQSYEQAKQLYEAAREEQPDPVVQI